MRRLLSRIPIIVANARDTLIAVTLVVAVGGATHGSRTVGGLGGALRLG